MKAAQRRPVLPAEAELAARLARLWPHREHESNSVKALACASGLHRWRRLDLGELGQGRDVQYCFWCSAIRIGREIFRS